MYFRYCQLLVFIYVLMRGGLAIAYDAGMPNPPANPTVVDIGVFIADIVNLDELNETFEAEMILFAEWQDPRMAFDPEEDGVDQKIFQGEFQFNEIYPGWWPQLLFVNEIGSGDMNAIKITVNPDGEVLYLEQRNITLETPMSLRRFPFDVQQLEAVIIPFGDFNDQVVFNIDQRLEGASEDYAENNKNVNIAQWTLQELEMEVRDVEVGVSGLNKYFSSVLVTIEMARKPANMIWKVIVPLVILVTLMWAVFWMDVDALSDRLNIAFIGILTVVAYQFLIDGNMPRISYFTFTDAVLLYSFFIMCLTVYESIILYWFCRMNKKQTAEKIDTIAQWCFPAVYMAGIVVFYFYYIYRI